MYVGSIRLAQLCRLDRVCMSSSSCPSCRQSNASTALPIFDETGSISLSSSRSFKSVLTIVSSLALALLLVIPLQQNLSTRFYHDQNDREGKIIAAYDGDGSNATATAAMAAKYSGEGKEKGNSAASEQCLNLELNQDMDSLVASARQIFVTMPAKAGGTSIKQFASRCSKKKTIDNVLNSGNERFWKQFLVKSLHVQPIIASHLYTDAPLIRLAQYPTREMLIIHIHREESSRVVSGVKQVSRHICNFAGSYANQQQITKQFNVRKNKTHCILDEGSMVDEIAARGSEVAVATHDLLTCQSYKAIQENDPQLVFLHYKQVDKLHTLLAKHHCPEMLDELPIRANAGDANPLKVLLHKGTDHVKNAVDIEEWLHAKGPALEWTLKLRRGASCQAKTTHMEDELFGCPDEALRATPASIARW